MNRAYFNGLKVVAKQAVFDSDYQAILDYATAQGFTLPSGETQALQNQLVLDIKASGAWSKLRFFAVHASGGDEDFALIDWKNPGVMVHERTGSPIYNPNTGFTGDGGSGRIIYGYNPVANNENHILSFGSHYGGVESNFQRPLHDNGTGTTRRIAIITDNRGGSIPDLVTRHGASNNDTAAQTIDFGGHIHVNRNETTNYKVYRNGVLLNTLNVSFSNYFNSDLQAMGSNLDILTVQLNYAAGDLENEIVAFNTAISNYINAL